MSTAVDQNRERWFCLNEYRRRMSYNCSDDYPEVHYSTDGRFRIEGAVDGMSRNKVWSLIMQLEDALRECKARVYSEYVEVEP